MLQNCYINLNGLYLTADNIIFQIILLFHMHKHSQNDYVMESSLETQISRGEYSRVYRD